MCIKYSFCYLENFVKHDFLTAFIMNSNIKYIKYIKYIKFNNQNAS